MGSMRGPRRARRTLAVVAVVVLSLLAGPALGADRRTAAPADRSGEEHHGLPNHDVRSSLPAAVRPNAAQQRLLARLRDARVHWDGLLGAPSMVVRHGGRLSPPSAASAEEVALAYLRANAALYRLSPMDLRQVEVADVARTESLRMTHVLLRRRDGDRRVFGSALTVHVDDDGRVSTVGGALHAGATAVGLRRLDADAATAAARAALGAHMTVTDAPELVTFPMGAAAPARLAWVVFLDDPDGHYETVVDALTGELLFRQNHMRHAGAEGNVYTVQNPTLGTQQIVPFSGLGRTWVEDRTTLGNNTYAGHDLDGNNTIDYSPETPASGDPAYQHFAFTYTDAIAVDNTDLTTDRDAVITQAFYYANMLHDRLYVLGFDEANRNFQHDNFGLGGAGGDRVNVYVDWGANAGQCCNARMITPADGSSPTLQLRVGLAPSNRNMHRAMNGDTVTHEWAHGLHTRLVGMGSYGSGLQADALGEGWADALATSVWNDPVYGEYNNDNAATGIRSVAYDDSTRTFSQFSGTAGEHSNGEIWATAMWRVREVFTAKYGSAGGTTRFEQNMVDGMKLTPSSPTYLQARDAFLQANADRYAGTEHCSLWQAFARTGLGASATIDNASGSAVTEASDVAAECRPTADAGGPYSTLEGADVALTGAASASGSHPSAGGLSFQWDLDDDGEFDDAGGPSPTFTRVGQDASSTVRLRVITQAGAEDTATATVSVANAAPALAWDVTSPVPEGTPVTAAGAVSDPGWLDHPLSATIAWTGGPTQPVTGPSEGSRPDATLTFSSAHTYGDDGLRSVQLCGADDDTTTCAAKTATITNVAPTVQIDAAQVTTSDEGEVVQLTASFTDPGWEDAYFVAVDWGTGLAGSVTAPTPVMAEGGPGPDVGTVTGTFTYGDTGVFPVTVTVTDDDGGVGQASFDVTVDNVDPSAAVDLAGATVVNGVQTILAHVGEPVAFSGRATDPGSDDLLLSWTWDDGTPDDTSLTLVNPPTPDAAPSPTVQPRDETFAVDHTFGQACAYDVGFAAADDDGGLGSDAAAVLITGNETQGRPAGWWHSEYQQHGTGPKVDPVTLACYLDITRFASALFSEVVSLETLADAEAVLHPTAELHPRLRVRLDRELLAAWLNFAAGVYDWDTAVHDSDGDRVADRTFAQVVGAAEAARLDPTTPDAELQAHIQLLKQVSQIRR